MNHPEAKPDLVAMMRETNHFLGQYRSTDSLGDDFLLVSEVKDLLSVQKRILESLIISPVRESSRICKLFVEGLTQIRSRTIDVSGARRLQFALLGQAYRERLLEHIVPPRGAEQFLAILKELV